MSNFIVTKDGELMHYGVKGMKWGVRRSLGVKARAAALNKKVIDSADKKIKKLETVKAKKGLTDRQMRELKTQKAIKKTYEKTRNSLTKDLSPKDIKRGERVIAARGLLGISRAIFDTADLIKGDKLLERERNRK